MVNFEIYNFLLYHDIFIKINLTSFLCKSYRNGPFFYLSKLESAKEAGFWNEVFTWTEDKLKLPYGSIKACILIENILAAFEMEAMLYNIKDHAIGLNCGMWDYSASILAYFGHRPDFVLPDRHSYVNINAKFMRAYYAKVQQSIFQCFVNIFSF
jgi:malate synthase A